MPTTFCPEDADDGPAVPEDTGEVGAEGGGSSRPVSLVDPLASETSATTVPQVVFADWVVSAVLLIGRDLSVVQKWIGSRVATPPPERDAASRHPVSRPSWVHPAFLLSSFIVGAPFLLLDLSTLLTPQFLLVIPAFVGMQVPACCARVRVGRSPCF